MLLRNVAKLEEVEKEATLIVVSEFSGNKPNFDTYWGFTQLWGSTSLGFDITENGEPTMGGQAMTNAVTFVLHDSANDCFLVFFDYSFAYIVSKPSNRFFEDLGYRNMASVSRAKDRY